jgi:soluble lytic murein transglycosylase-like protein
VRRCAAVLVAAALLLAGGARADEGIARRLAALRRLVDPAARGPVRVDPGACPGTAWWEASEYGVLSRVEAAIRDASLRFATDPALIRSVIRIESNGDPRAVSHKGALGLMQLMPATAAELGVGCAFDPRENVLAGTRYLRRLYERLGTWARALAAYHAGPARVDAGRIPAETHRYVAAVWRRWRPGQGVPELE